MKAEELERVVNDLTVDILLGEDNPNEPFSIKVKQGFDTACWSFLPPHQIYVGDGIFKRAKKRLSSIKKVRYVSAYVRHELAHLRRTERDFNKVNKALADAGIPFGTWNLFEDARIEHIERSRTGEKFCWAEYEELEGNPSGIPGQEFFLLIQEENENRELRNPAVVEFYDHAIAAPDSLALIPLIQEWIRRFGDIPVPPRFGSEMETSFQVQTDGKFREAFEATLVDSTKSTDKGPKNVKVKSKVKGQLLSDDRHPVDFALANKLANRFLSLFAVKTVHRRSDEPSGRISGRHLALDRAPYRHTVAVKATVKKLCLVVDCSGSMDGQPIEGARLLAAALNYLASIGKITGCLILSAVVGDKATSQVFDFPVDEEVITRIHAFGNAEGLNAAVLQNLDKLEGADQVFVKTDGSINDEPIDKRKVKAKGIAMCGLYAGDTSNAEDMQLHFERFMIRNTVENLVDALLQSRLA